MSCTDAVAIFHSSITKKEREDMECTMAIKLETCIPAFVLREPPEARRGTTALPNIYFEISLGCVLPPIVQISWQVVTNLAVRQRTREAIKSYVRLRLC